MPELKQHYVQRAGWLRASVLGANDGLISIAALIVGVAAASAGREEVLLAGIAGLVAGAMSMAAGEYVSVSSQSDIENADLAREVEALAVDPENELDELIRIYQSRGVDVETAYEVARQMTAHDALGAHARDELGIHEHNAAQPLQAAGASAISFAVGAGLPVLAVLFAPMAHVIPIVVMVTLLSLALLGATGARLGGAPKRRPTLRVLFWGSVAMATTALVGSFAGAVL